MALIERGNETRKIQAPFTEIMNAIRQSHGAGAFRILLPGETVARQVIVKAVDRDTLSQKVRHLSLMQVSDTDRVEMEVQVEAEGTPEEVSLNTANLEAPTRHVKLVGRIAALPETLVVPTGHLKMGDAIQAGDVKLPVGVELLSSADSTLFVLSPLRAAKVDEPIADAVSEATPSTPEP